MPLFVNIEKSVPTPSRHFPFLPRVALILDIGGRKLTFKSAPLLETLAEMKNQGLDFKALVHVSKKMFDEIPAKGHERNAVMTETRD